MVSHIDKDITRDITNKVKLRSQFEEMDGDDDGHFLSLFLHTESSYQARGRLWQALIGQNACASLPIRLLGRRHEVFQNNVRPALALICSCVNSCNCYNRCLLPAVIAKTGRRFYSVVLDKFAAGFQGETICRHSPCINKWV